MGSTSQDANHSSPNVFYTYDTKNRLKSINQLVESGVWAETVYAYDVKSNLVGITDANGNTTTYDIDDFGQTLAIISPVTGESTFSYDKASNLTSSEDAAVASLVRKYDALNRIIEEDIPSGAEVTTGPAGQSYPTDHVYQFTKVTWNYDDPSQEFGVGRVTNIFDQVAEHDFTYDRRGLVVEKSTLYHAFGDWIVAGTAAYNMQQQYDIEGIPVLRIYPSGLRVLSDYDWADRPAGVSFQRLGKNSPIESIITETLYEPFGPMSVKHYANGWSEGRTYDERYFLDELQVVNDSGQFITKLNYLKDNVGNILQIDDVSDQATSLLFGNGKSGRNFVYDDLYRLTQTQPITVSPNQSLFDPITFDIDPVGNRSKATTTNSLGIPSNTDYVYYPDDGSGKNDSRLKSVSSGRAYTYDQRGQPIDDGNTYYWYDNRARLLAEVAHSGDGSLRHMYDYSGKRSAHFGGGGGNPNNNITVALAAFWGNENICEEQYPLTSGPNAVLDRIYFAGSPVATIYSGGWGDLTRVFLSDHLGTTYANGDESGNVLWRAEYKPFGEIAQITVGNSDEDPGFRFPGQELDDWFQTGTTDLTELNYNVHRYFDPEIGRYTQPDPIGLIGGINLFSYSSGNPITRFDLNGLADNTNPWQLGWEWLSGTGPKHHSFGPGDPVTNNIQKHSHVGALRNKVQNLAYNKCTNCDSADESGRADYSLKGFKGVPKYVRDYSTLGTLGQTGNLAVTYLGSFRLDWWLLDIDCCSGSANLRVEINNASSAASAFRPPVIGYTEIWGATVGAAVNYFAGSTGMMSETSQTIRWDEQLNFEGNKNCQ